MEKNRLIFFQVLLVLIALIFICAVKYIAETRSTTAGSFTGDKFYGNVTVTDAFSALDGRKDR